MTLTQIKPAGLSKPVDLADNEKIRLGTGNDLQIYHNGSNSYVQDVGTGNLHLTSNGTAVSIDKGTSENMAVFNTDGAVELYHNGSKKFETQSTGIHVTGDVSITGDYLADDNERLKMGNGFDLQIYHDGTNNYIESTGKLYIKSSNFVDIRSGGNETMIKATSNGAVELYYDNSKKFETASYGCLVTGNLGFTDGDKAVFGVGSDLQIYHNGSNSYIEEGGTGALIFKSNTYSFRNAADNEQIASFNENGAVELYYDNSKKLETTSSGISVSGKVNIGDTQMSSNLLNIEDGTAAAIDLASHGSGGDTAYIGVKKSTGGGLTFGISNRDIIFKTGATYSNGTTFDSGTERMRIDSVGRVGIGITPVNRILHTSSGSSQSRIQIDNTTNSNGLQIGADGNGSFQSTLSANEHLIYTNGVLRARWTANGLCFNGDTAAANALDDYEEGTWTPTVVYNGGTGTHGSNNYGYYTKVGNIVTAHATVHWTAFGGSTVNFARINGLPYAYKNSSAYRATYVIGGQVVGVQAGEHRNVALGSDANNSFLYITPFDNAQTVGGGNYSHFPVINSSGTIFGLAVTYLTN
jgi:hypothetical protein